MMPKAPGSEVFSGAINGENALTLRATRLAVDSRYARIMTVMRDSEQRRPQLPRLGDQLGSWYMPIALGLAIVAWTSTESGSIPRCAGCRDPMSTSDRHSGRDHWRDFARSQTKHHHPRPAYWSALTVAERSFSTRLERLMYGQPALTDRLSAPGKNSDRVLQLAASLERYSETSVGQTDRRGGSRRTSASSRCHRSQGTTRARVARPGGKTDVRVIGRVQAEAAGLINDLPPMSSGLECVILLDGRYAATYRFHDAPREDSRSLITHLGPRHQFDRMLLVSGDRASEVRYLGERVGIDEIHAGQTPEQKVAITRQENAGAPTLFIGDGINETPAPATATVGLAFGHQSEITTEAAGAVVMDTSLKRVDELFHLARRMRRIALQSAIGGMLLSVVGMFLCPRRLARAGRRSCVPGGHRSRGGAECAARRCSGW